MCKFYLRRHRNGRCKLIDKIVKCQSMLHKCECCNLLREEIINENKSLYEKWCERHSISNQINGLIDEKEKEYAKHDEEAIRLLYSRLIDGKE